MVLMAGLVCSLLLIGCTTSGTAPALSPTRSAAGGYTSDNSGVTPGYQGRTKDEFSPLIITELAPNPSPVKGSDNSFHMAYELSVFNDSPRDAMMTQIETLASNENGPVLATLNQEQVAANTQLAGDYSASMIGSATIPAGRTAFVVFREAYPTKAEIPETFTHRISATFAPPAAGQSIFAAKYPDSVVQIGGIVSTGTLAPIVIGPPLSGDNWVAFSGLTPDGINAHSFALAPIGGRINGTERFAIDFIRLDPTAPPASKGVVGSFHGDATKNSSYLAFDEPLLAVAQATVVKVVSDQPDETPSPVPVSEAPLDLVTGNVIILDLGDGVFALYAHMKMNSAEVRVGDKVTKGQEIGRLGNSGNSTEAHLHFQLQNGLLPLASDNRSWVIDRFTAAGTFGLDGIVSNPVPGPRTDELPLANSVSNFP
ncbi:M23 family metallopeptidase [soil metagenome]